MFDLDNWAEIFSVIRKNKLRTFLTGFSVSWGILMFCILLSSGNGIKNGVMSNFESRAINSVEFWGRRTSKPYKGLPEGRRIVLDNKDLDLVNRQMPEAMNVSGLISTSVSVSNKTFNSTCNFNGVNPDFREINGVKVVSGRFINEMDMREHRKVAVINRRLSEVLFQNADPTGKMFIADSLAYTVIGVYKSDNDMGNEQSAYIPFSTAQLLYNKGWGIDEIAFTVKGLDTKQANEEFDQRLRKKLSVLHIFDADDKRPVGIWNRLENYLETMGIFNGISLFIWIIGTGTLIAGIISISNIMLITVRERTKEFGIRKALGAKPSSILGSILMESAVITSIFGYFGMFMGVGLGELINSALANAEGSPISYIFRNPTVDVKVAVGAMLVLIVSGIVAGLYPALRAVRISPVEAMKDE
ncbi:MAG: ABC transporter permease [Prevotellaceae bacterium]|jgi:putative ABC transport system permease protein|nr:ABC transporter permease [Prevotellaceae bacterium]